MSALWIVQVAAEAGERHFNAIVQDDDRKRAEATAEEVVRREGWADAQATRSGRVAQDKLQDRSAEFQRSVEVARDLGWSLIVYLPTN